MTTLGSAHWGALLRLAARVHCPSQPLHHAGSAQNRRGEIQPGQARSLLEVRYPGIRTPDITVTLVFEHDGCAIGPAPEGAILLYCLWLAADSQIPAET